MTKSYDNKQIIFKKYDNDNVHKKKACKKKKKNYETQFLNNSVLNNKIKIKIKIKNN
jgi:hypothetical protein